MNKYIVGIVVFFLLLAFVIVDRSINNHASENVQNTAPSDKLVILWTSDNPSLAETMVFMYAHNAKRNGWFDEVTIIIWGPSAKLAADNEEIQAYIRRMMEDGVKIEVCIACAQMRGVETTLRELGYDVRGMGRPLTDYLKRGYRVLTF